MDIHVIQNPAKSDLNAVRQGLIAYNLATVPAIANLPRADLAVVARDETGDIIGGCAGEIDWGWLFIDSIWVDRRARKSGLGKRIMTRMEQAALELGVDHAYLLTSSFQAAPFYVKLGYEHIGHNEDRPPGHSVYYMAHMHISPEPVDTSLELQNPAVRADVDTVEHGLIAHSRNHVPIEPRLVGAFVYSAGHGPGSGKLLAGVYGYVFWNWCDLRLLWVDESVRGHGLGTQIMDRFEDACRDWGMVGMVLDTASFQAQGFYEKRGYRTFATLADRPPGYTTAFMEKRL